MDRQFIKLPKLPHSRKDYDHRKTFGAGAPAAFPARLVFPSRILNQGNKPSCTAYAAVAMRESMTGKLYDPEAQWQQELFLYGDANARGVDLDTQMATGIQVGFVPQGATAATDKAGAWFNVTPTKSVWSPGGLDTFDAIKDAMSAHQVPLSVAMDWYSDWDAAPNGIVPHSFNNLLGGHDTKCAGFVTIDGVDYLTIQNSWGEGFGSKGVFYFDRFMANKCFTQGIKYWLDNVPADVKQLGLLAALYLNLKNLMTALAKKIATNA
jgi:hypothetical protein